MLQNPEKRPAVVIAILIMIVLLLGSVSLGIVLVASLLVPNGSPNNIASDISGVAFGATETAAQLMVAVTLVPTVRPAARPITVSPTDRPSTPTHPAVVSSPTMTRTLPTLEPTATPTFELPLLQTAVRFPEATPLPILMLPVTPAFEPTPIAEQPAVPSVVPVTGSVSAIGGNVRNGPGIGNPSIGVLTRGDELIILGINNGWYLVRLGANYDPRSTISGDQGWISAQIVTTPSGPVVEITPVQ